MEHKIFPTIYAYQQRKDEEVYENQKNCQMGKAINACNEKYTTKTEKLNSSFPYCIDCFGAYMWVFGIAFAILGAIVLFIVGCILHDPMIQVAGLFEGALCGALLAVVLYPIYLCFKYGIIDPKAEIRTEEIKQEQQKAIESITQSISAEISQHCQDTEKRIRQYNDDFEKEAQKLSTEFANSALAKEIAQWLSSGFLRTVQATDRTSNIEKIVVPCNFHVDKDEIRCNIGSYNFDEHRCEPLADALSQAALARALASQVQVAMLMQYEKDTSGTSYKIDISYQYPEPLKQTYYLSSMKRDIEIEDGISVTLNYTAPNGNYKQTRKW